jgi:hypothetical protein
LNIADGTGYTPDNRNFSESTIENQICPDFLIGQSIGERGREEQQAFY